MDSRLSRFVMAAVAAAVLSGCEALSLTALGIGASAGIAEVKNGSVHRTFPYALPRIRQATLVALRRMDIQVGGASGGLAGREVIRAAVGERRIEIELEPLSERAGRITVTVKASPLVYDAATASEIVRLTERALLADG